MFAASSCGIGGRHVSSLGLLCTNFESKLKPFVWFTIVECPAPLTSCLGEKREIPVELLLAFTLQN